MDKMKLEKKEIKKIKRKITKKRKKIEFPKTGHESRTYYDRVVSGFYIRWILDLQSFKKVG